jgi:hypothetical protein
MQLPSLTQSPFFSFNNSGHWNLFRISDFGFRICATRLVYLPVLLVLFSAGWSPVHAALIPIILSSEAPRVERLAAQDLARILHQLYPADQFVLAEALPAAGQCVLVGDVAQDAEVRKRVAANKLTAPESYVVSVAHEAERQIGIFQGLEQFIAAFFQTQGDYQQSRALEQSGDLSGARAVMASCQPGKVIEQYAQFSSLGGITRGEQGLVVSLNLRWLTHMIQQRQTLGLEPVRVNFAATQHDKLAQAAGRFTFYFEPNRTVWECLGAEETGGKVFTLPAGSKVIRAADLPESWEEICRSGVESAQPLVFTLRPMMTRENRGAGGLAALTPGDYRLHLLFLDPSSSAPEQRVFDLALDPGSDSKNGALHDQIDIFRLAGAPNRLVERKYEVSVNRSGAVKVVLTPIKGHALICGAVLEAVF